MCRRYRCFLFLMLLWLPVKGVLSAAMPFHEMRLSADLAATQMSHCQMFHGSQGAIPMMALNDAESVPALDHEQGGQSGYSQSITCHGLCAVFLATNFVPPLIAVAVDAPPSVSVAFYSHIPAFPDRPPVL